MLQDIRPDFILSWILLPSQTPGWNAHKLATSEFQMALKVLSPMVVVLMALKVLRPMIAFQMALKVLSLRVVLLDTISVVHHSISLLLSCSPDSVNSVYINHAARQNSFSSSCRLAYKQRLQFLFPGHPDSDLSSSPSMICLSTWREGTWPADPKLQNLYNTRKQQDSGGAPARTQHW